MAQDLIDFGLTDSGRAKWSLSETASLISDPGRAAMLMALLGGVTLPAGQLALIANIAPQTASSHLSKLVSGELLAVEQQGRHRYYRLINSEVAHAIEALLAVTPPRKKPPASSLAQLGHTNQNLSFARTCYSHLAGKLAVQIVAILESRHYLAAGEPRRYEVTKRGRAWFQEFGIPVDEMRSKHPRFARRCLDWTERRPHLAGSLGCALLDRFRNLKWVAPVRASRALRVTIQGQHELQRLFGIRIASGAGNNPY